MPRFREDSSWSPSETAEGLFHRGARPFVLKVAQSFLVIIVAIYLTKLAAIRSAFPALRQSRTRSAQVSGANPPASR